MWSKYHSLKYGIRLHFYGHPYNSSRMKFFLTSLLVLIVPFSGRAQTENKVPHYKNYLDSINNARQIEELVAKIDERYKKFKVDDALKFTEKICQKLTDSLKIEPYSKADFDNNGLTDLLVIGKYYGRHYVLCILDKGDNSYEIETLTKRAFQECTFPKIIKDGSLARINYFFQQQPQRGNWDKPTTIQKSTLIYRFDSFIEENKNIKPHTIEKIEYETTGCYGTCPIFRLTIEKNGSMVFDAQEYNVIYDITKDKEINKKEMKGVYRSTLPGDDYSKLTEIINYLDFENLANAYAVGWTDDQSCTLKITYDNGKVKSINDYGLLGTFGLRNLYDKLFSLRQTKVWTK
jgi:hypothetical protein